MSVGVIGGSGFYEFPDMRHSRLAAVQTPFGETSLSTGYIGETQVCFIARHGTGHRVPPHKIGYRANIWALKSVGVTRIYALNAVGGITAQMKPAARVLPTQLIDYTYGREHTFADVLSDQINHIDFTEPFSASLRQALKAIWDAQSLEYVDGGVLGCTQGPRLETAAEVQCLKRDGCDLVGMTSMPEAALARELGMEYAPICTVVNWAAGISAQPITLDDIHRILNAATPLLRKSLVAVIQSL